MAQTGAPISRYERAEHSAAFLLWKSSTLWQRHLRNALEPIGLTHSQFVLLSTVHYLNNLPDVETVNQVAVSNQSGIDVMTVSTVLRTLESRGLITRRPNRTDTRAKVLTTTPEALPLLLEAIKIYEECEHNYFAAMGNEIETFNRLTLKLIG